MEAVQPEPGVRIVRRLSFVTLLWLTIQFLLGMLVNLFVKIPQHPGANAQDFLSGAIQSLGWALSQGPVGLIVHALVGIFLLLLAAVVFALAIASRRRSLIVGTGIGLLGILAGAFSGTSFLVDGEDLSSMFMASGLALALVAYTTLLWDVGAGQDARTSVRSDG